LIDIRAAVPSDCDALLALFGEVAAERVHIATEPGFDRDRYRAGWLEAIADPARLLIVAVDGERIVGSLTTWPVSSCGISLGMHVSAAHRRRGAGRALLDAAAAWGRSTAAPALVLRVFPHNTAAIALYESAGFVEIERRERDVPRQDGEVWDTILMRKCLS
jgi:ribosomal-protein-alanine N-acetyltransferase